MTEDRITGIGSRSAAFLYSTTRIVTWTGAQTPRRSGVIITGYSDGPVYGKLVTRGAAAPTVTISDRDFIIPVDKEYQVRCSESIDIYLQGGTASAVEVI